jgi:hypothetical protein
MSECAHCGEVFFPKLPELASRFHLVARVQGRPRRFCSDRCRKRAWRRRQAGIAEHALVDAGARGHVRLAQRTRAQERERWRRVAAELEAALKAAA